MIVCWGWVGGVGFGLGGDAGFVEGTVEGTIVGLGPGHGPGDRGKANGFLARSWVMK